MKKNVLITLLAALLLSSCGEYNKLLKSTDYEYKYEAAKNYFAKGQYSRAATLLNELIAILKGTDKAEESLYMLGMSYYNQKDYQLPRRHLPNTIMCTRAVRSPNWRVSMPEKHCSWIRRNPVWTSPVHTVRFSNCKCSSNISLTARRKTRPKA